MLVLTRKQNEKIRIGSSIVITVVRMKGKAVRLGIEAPGDVSILRGELAFDTSAVEAQAGDSKAAIKESTDDQPPRSKVAQLSTPNPRRNPTWPAEPRDIRAMTDPMSSPDLRTSLR